MNDQRARDGVQHLQAAAIEVIESLRAFLDVAEDLVRDPARVTDVVDAFRRGSQGADRDGNTSGVTRIRVS